MPLRSDDPSWIVPAWRAPPGVRAAVSTRLGPGASVAPFDRFNLGMRSGDAPDAVKQRHIDNCTRADPAYGAGVAQALAALRG